MKKIAILFLLSFAITSGFAQKQLQEHFEKDLISYTTAFNNKDWNRLTEMMYPPLFKLMSKENMLQVLGQMDKLGISMSTDFKSIDSMSDIVEYKNEKYCKIAYFGIINVTLSGPMAQGSSLLQIQFEQEFGKENVNYQKNTNSFTIDAHRSMLAVANKKSDNWKYIDIDSPQAKGLKKLIPAKVQQQLN